ncbi:glycyl-radical enzyme activating protein [bacterium]|nr:glycyl-radical enzyme activating protein [bacterium]
MKENPLILEIKGNSLDDGPGIRTVVFFKGCPLSCVWCHNPESKSGEVEISFDSNACIACDTCLGICTKDALSRNSACFVNRDRCDLCFNCVDPCPSEALSSVGKEMTLDEVMTEILKDKPFFKTSGGGVTLSGGEPLVNMRYVSELMKKLKMEEVSVLLETCGLFNFNFFEELILPLVQSIYMDIKLIDSDEHKKYCGVTNAVILENFRKIHLLSLERDFEILPRVPLVPDITDTEANLRGIADFLKENQVKKVQLLNYNPLWHEKCDKIGAENTYKNEENMTKWMATEKVKTSKEVFTCLGIEVI